MEQIMRPVQLSHLCKGSNMTWGELGNQRDERGGEHGEHERDSLFRFKTQFGN